MVRDTSGRRKGCKSEFDRQHASGTDAQNESMVHTWVKGAQPGTGREIESRNENLGLRPKCNE
jgi:hypothetical protein